MQIEYTDAINFLMNCDDAYILTHQSPDGDTIGSAFALCYLLKELGKRSKIICPDGLPERYNFMYTDYEEADFEPDCIIAVDIADPKLLGKYREVYGDKVNLCIDHHYSNILYAEKTLFNAHAGATCEIIYRLINLADIRCSDMMARCLYTGIATDTGCFKFENTTAETHRIVAEMMDNNHIEYAKINRLMFDIKALQDSEWKGLHLMQRNFTLTESVHLCRLRKRCLRKTILHQMTLREWQRFHYRLKALKSELPCVRGKRMFSRFPCVQAVKPMFRLLQANSAEAVISVRQVV